MLTKTNACTRTGMCTSCEASTVALTGWVNPLKHFHSEYVRRSKQTSRHCSADVYCYCAGKFIFILVSVKVLSVCRSAVSWQHSVHNEGLDIVVKFKKLSKTNDILSANTGCFKKGFDPINTGSAHVKHCSDKTFRCTVSQACR